MPMTPDHVADVVTRLSSQHRDLEQGAYYTYVEDPRWDATPAGAEVIVRLAAEVDHLQAAVRLLVERFWDDTPMGPNVIDLPDVRWRILTPSLAGAVQRALRVEV